MATTSQTAVKFPGHDGSGKVDPMTCAYSGTTAQRPTEAPVGMEYFDTDLGKPIWWSGSAWVTDLNVAGQAAVEAAPGAITAYAAVTTMTNPVTKAEGEAVSAAVHQLQTEVTALRTTVASILTKLKAAGLMANA